MMARNDPFCARDKLCLFAGVGTGSATARRRLGSN